MVHLHRFVVAVVVVVIVVVVIVLVVNYRFREELILDINELRNFFSLVLEFFLMS